MKRLLTLVYLLITFSVAAQYSSQDIRKFRVAKITKSSQAKGNESVQKNETWYDQYGNDTAEYNGSEVYRRTIYEYNSQGQMQSRTRYGADGSETETATCSYKPDGSCTVRNTDKSFGMTDFAHCDKNGKTTKTIAPDKSQRIYSYDSKGRLIKIKSNDGDHGGLVVDIQYSYNPKGQLVKEVSKGDYKWTAVYTYGSNGMIVKVKRNSVTDGVADPEVITTYEYEFRKDP